MKKKTTTKLVLSKETLRSLSAKRLGEVVGGTWQGTCAGCPTHGGNSCDICDEQPITYSCEHSCPC